MVTQLREATRVARKPHRCDMCTGRIRVGDHHHVSTNLFDGRVYDWRQCLPCLRDRIITWVYDWAGAPDEGVGYDLAVEWAEGAVEWSRDARERAAARAWLARAAGGEGE